jgi:hypothetical protein
MRVEVRLRVPNMTHRAKDPNGYPIDHQAMRFRKTIDVPRLPKPDDVLELATQSGQIIPAIVLRTDWSEQGVVVSCRFARQSISVTEYYALSDDPGWELKHLLDDGAVECLA